MHELDIYVYDFKNCFIYDCGVSKKVTCVILLQEKAWELSELNTLKTRGITWNYA